MPCARVKYPKFSGHGWAGVAVFILLNGCSSPNAAGPGLQSGSAVVEAATNSGGASDPFVAAVRAGTMTGYPQATIGHAFDAAFSDAHWQGQQIEGGAHVVTFTGLLPPNMRTECGGAKPGRPAPACVQEGRVTFEWTFTPDGRFFHLSHIDPEVWPEDHRSTREMLLFIYG